MESMALMLSENKMEKDNVRPLSQECMLSRKKILYEAEKENIRPKAVIQRSGSHRAPDLLASSSSPVIPSRRNNGLQLAFHHKSYPA
jgi:hypothetical protein